MSVRYAVHSSTVNGTPAARIFEKPGNYSIDLTVDGELASRVPFRVVQVQEEAPQT